MKAQMFQPRIQPLRNKTYQLIHASELFCYGLGGNNVGERMNEFKNKVQLEVRFPVKSSNPDLERPRPQLKLLHTF